jgi:DNA polymerase elongation subunit (family B)
MQCPANDQPRILYLDIETKLMEVYSFGIRDQFIGHKQMKSHGGIHCVGLMWSGKKKPEVVTEWDHGTVGMLRLVHAALMECDAVATYNGAAFDIPKLNGAFMVAGLPPMKPLTQIDLFKAIRKMGFPSRKLDYIAPLLGLGSKVKHDGLDLWINVLNGDEKARKRMVKYCAGDVILTRDLHERIKAYIPDYPRLGNRHGLTCPNCGSDHMTSQGWKITRTTRVQSLKCGACGSWTQGKRERIAA